MASNKIRTLIVDDSAAVRGVLRCALEHHPRIELVGFAADGRAALDELDNLKPHVVVIDLDMPRLGGLPVIERIAGSRPIAFITVTTLTQTGARKAFDALERGAFDYIAKPQAGSTAELPTFQSRLQAMVIAAGRARKRDPFLHAGPHGSAATVPPNRERDWVIAIGAGSGGPQTLLRLLPAFSSDTTPVVIAQHMPAEYTRLFARRLHATCEAEVCEAEPDEPLRRGVIYLAPGGFHLRVVRRDSDLCAALERSEKHSGHRPSIDVLFESVATACGPRSIGVVLSGVGRDGVAGIRRLRRARAWTVAQSEDSSLAGELPSAAIECGCIDRVAPLEQIPEMLADLLADGVRRPALVRSG